MSTTRLQLRTRVQQHLDDVTAGVWSVTLLNAFLDEGLRRCAPVLLKESTGNVSPTDGFTFVALPSDCVYVVRAYCLTAEMPPWRQFAGLLRMDEALPASSTVTVEYLGTWLEMDSADGAPCPLADYQADVLVHYAVSRAYLELARNRVRYDRYSATVNNQVDLEEIVRLSESWYEDFLRMREESKSRRQIMYERDRRAGSGVAE